MRINISKIVNSIPKERRLTIINNGTGIEVLALAAQATNFEDKNPLWFYARYCQDAPPVWLPADQCEITDALAPPDWEIYRTPTDSNTDIQFGFQIGPKNWHKTLNLAQIMYSNLDDIDHNSKEWKLFEETLARYTKLSDENITKRKQFMAELDS